MRELTREELLDYRKGGYLTVGRLKEILAEHDYSDDAIIVVQRVEDQYYEGGLDISGFLGCPDTPDGVYPPGSKSGEWGVYLKDGDPYRSAVKHNKDIDSGKYENKEKYPNIKPEELKKYSEEELHLMKTQYHPVWSPAVYFEEKEIVFLDLHY